MSFNQFQSVCQGLRWWFFFVANYALGIAVGVCLAAATVPWPPVLLLGGIALVSLSLAWIGRRQPEMDIWKYQERMLRASSQQVAHRPEINATALLYYALTLEELSEFSKAVVTVMVRKMGTVTTGDWHLFELWHDLKNSSEELTARSKRIRAHLSKTRQEALTFDMNRTEAKDCFDGILDATVTIAGMGVAAGYPCADGYREVQISNLSKANPATGLIDKDRSGKWVKGPNYAPPNLDAVLDAQALLDD